MGQPYIFQGSHKELQGKQAYPAAMLLAKAAVYAHVMSGVWVRRAVAVFWRGMWGGWGAREGHGFTCSRQDTWNMTG